jgi:hypothetical protein
MANQSEKVFTERKIVMMEGWRAELVEQLGKPASQRRPELAELPEFRAPDGRPSVAEVLRQATDALFFNLGVRELEQNSPSRSTTA